MVSCLQWISFDAVYAVINLIILAFILDTTVLVRF